MSIQTIGDMTPWQTRHVYFHPRHKDGRVMLPTESIDGEIVGSGPDLMKDWADTQRKLGKSDAEIESQWLQMLLGTVNEVNRQVEADQLRHDD